MGNRSGVAAWHKLLVEFLYTKNQGGPPWAPSSPSGAESYYNHGQFIQGWAYDGNRHGKSVHNIKSICQGGVA
ncbi:MAG: hypothetical protein AB2L20_05195 [Mangrovibacterium sp.]